MTDAYRKVAQYEKLLGEKRFLNEQKIENITTLPCDYKKGSTLPSLKGFQKLSDDATWGSGKDSHAWFHFEIPAQPKDSFLKVHTSESGWSADNPQFIVYINGHLRQGMDTNHTEVRLDDNTPADVYLYGYTGKVETTKLFAATYVLNTAVDELFYDIYYPLEMLDYLDKESGEYASILEYLYRAVSMINWNEEEDFTPSVKRAHEYLAKEFYGSYCSKQKATTVCIGHTHIDCAWLWTLRQTKEKVQRSFGTVLELMKRYPEYRFMSSQALLYQDLKEEAPDLYREIGERVKEGRWEVEGSMWVEADCNLSSGESLVRQVLYGKQFFKEEFGVENRVLWLPDVFGYSAALPQILKKSGVDWFVTSKISWNDTNQMPYDTFLWKGIDGTGINSYFLTAQKDTGAHSVKHTTYVGKTDAQMISGTYKRYRQKNLNDEVLLTFGFGDGGGGPTAEHLELVRRGSYGVPGSPNAKIGFAGDFLTRLEKKIENNPELPTWQGELYLEFHRGTYTTMCKNKRFNRKGEFLFENAEYLATLQNLLLGSKYPKAELEKGWKILLTNQFHDIIPGSSIKEVYEQSDIDYKEAFGIGEKIVSDAQRAIAGKIAANEGYVVFNPHSYTAKGYVTVDGKTVLTKTPVASKGYTVMDSFVTENHVKINGKTVETNLFRITFDDAWQISSIYDKKNEREVLLSGCAGNELRVYADQPDSYDAWEWQIYSRDEYQPILAVKSAKVVDDGARKGIRIIRPYQKSTVTQTVWFYDDLEKIDFDTTVDWHETHQMLKTAFPVDVNSDKATYEIQFGTIERPTHFNTEWDQAKFEVCAHKYADLSDGGYGVSILNDCKYGHDIHDGVIQLSLLRSPTYPNPDADQGEMTCTYSICPHNGRLTESRTAELAYYLNEPMTAVKATGEKTALPKNFSTVTIDRENIICETVKTAENGKGTVLRFYESQNKKTKAKVTLGIDAKKVTLCDLMENELCELPVKDGTVTLDFSGFEILTIKV